MANINSLTSNSYGNSYNLYGNRNVLTGLASGMDTEAMIQNSISGYMMKISSLQQSQTKIQWKQDAYRSIIDQMNSIIQKYTSYTSKTNLASNAFFTNAVSTSTLGKYASAITATGSTKSDIQINSVTKLATAARYSVDTSELALNTRSEAVGKKIEWGAEKQIGQVKGTITLKLNNEEIDLAFNENDVNITDAASLQKAIEDKLAATEITAKGGEKISAKDAINVEVREDGTVTFSANPDVDLDGGKPYIYHVYGNVDKTLGAQNPESTEMDKAIRNDHFTVPDFSALVQTQTAAEYLSGKSIEVTLDGVKKTINLGELEEGTDTDTLAKRLQESLNDAFGNGKVTVKDVDGALRFDVREGSGSTVSVSSRDAGVGEMLGLGKNGVSNYFNTSNTLKDIVGEDWLKNNRIRADLAKTETSDDGTKYFDADGNRLVKDGENYYRADEKGNFIYSLEINGKSIGEFTEDSALESVINAINSSEAGVKVSYSNLTSQFVFTANETGADGKISFDNALAQKLFSREGNATGAGVGEFTEGQDAEVYATVNGKEVKLVRSSNVINMDGLTVTLKETFNVDTDAEGNPVKGAGEAVTFKTSSDSDKIVDAVKSFVEDINKLMQDIHDAYATMPLKKASSSKSSTGYEPLTEDDKKDMSESAINAYEEKAKTGLLFGDSDLSQLYSKLLSSIQATGADRIDMEAIGLTTTYSDGVTKLSLDEDRLRAALDSDPEKVRSVFAKTVEGGAKTDGLVASLKTTLNAYGSTSLASPGILVSKAGTKLSAISLMNNHLQKEYDNLEKQIEQWQSRMSDKVDYYTKQFTQLEKLMNTMNNQSSMLAGLMGGY